MNLIPNASQFAILGLGRFGSAVAKRLYALGKEVLAVDTDEQRVADVAEYVTHAVVADCLDESAMRQLGVDKFDVVVVAMGSNMQASILATLICKEMGVRYVVAKAQSFHHSKALEKIGADMVVFPETESGNRLATLLASPSVVELAEIAPNFKIVEIDAPAEWESKTLIELKIRQKHLLTVLAVTNKNGTVSSPSGEFVIQKGDKVVLCGAQSDIAKFAKKVQA